MTHNRRNGTQRLRVEGPEVGHGAKYDLVARGANDGLWYWDLEANRVEWSPRWKELLGHAPDEIDDRPEEWLGRVHPEDIESLRGALKEHLEGRAEYLHHEHRVLHKSGEYRIVVSRGLAARDATGRAFGVGGSLSDVSHGRAMEARLKHQASHDGLTGLPNRVAFLNVLERATRQRSRRADYLFAVLHIDLDRFSLVNGTAGQLVGDQLLAAIGSRLQGCVRPGDFVARLESDEFVVLVNGVGGSADVVRVADRIQQAIRTPFRLERRELVTSASVGIAVADHAADASTLLRDARAAVLRAKGRGRGRFEMSDPDLQARAVALLQLEADTQGALERNEFCLWYQPIVCLETRQVLGFEALVRWQHPQRGLVFPDEFVPAAEASGLIIPLGWWAVREACRQVRVWRRRFDLPSLFVSVNVSARQFRQPNLVDWIAEMMRQAGVAAGALKLEITESLLMEDPDAVLTLMERLQGLGIRLDIDDFGTGYSSLRYLNHLPVDGLKIDRSFVADLDRHKGTAEIVRTIVDLARALRIGVVAEGIETEAQAARLRALGCRHGQGYLFDRPLAAEEAERVLGQPAPARQA